MIVLVGWRLWERVEYDIGAEESVSTAVVLAVSAIKGSEPDDLEPLTRAVDPDALDSLFTPLDDERMRTGGRVSFVYSDCRVRIDNGEYLTIEPLDDRSIATRHPGPNTTRTSPNRRS